MIVVRIELHSANTGRVTEIGRMLIANVGGTKSRGDYHGKLLRRRDGPPSVAPAFDDWASKAVTREAEVMNHPRLSAPVWSLVGKMLKQMGFAP